MADTTSPGRSDSGWRPVFLRLAVLTLPAQLVGALLGFVPTLALGRRVLTVPWMPSLVLVGIGVVSGVAIGLLARPPRHQWAPAVAVAAGYGLVGFAVIGLLLRLRLPAGAAPSVLTWLVGAVVVVALQSLVVALVWRRRALR